MALKGNYTISEVAKMTGLAASAIRYYEDEGLLAEATGRLNGRRVFDAISIADLSFLTDLRLAGMTLADIKAFQAKRRSASGTCENLAAIAEDRAAKLRVQIRAMRLAEERLRQFAQNCIGQCGSTEASQCNQIGSLNRDMSSDLQVRP
jgi:DNA-binding transcriptional MerR regulator